MSYYVVTGTSYYNLPSGVSTKHMYRRMEVLTVLQAVLAEEDINDQIRKTGNKKHTYVTEVSLLCKKAIIEDISHYSLDGKSMLRNWSAEDPFYIHNGKIDLIEYLAYTWEEYFEDTPIN